MRILITGAGGFLGRYLVAAARRRGHDVRALVRPASGDASPVRDAPGIEVVRADLRSPRGLDAIVDGVDAVIHAAAAKSGDLYAQLAGTVVATENLLNAMDRAGVRRMVLVSSFAVYDYLGARPRSVLDESTPLEPRPERRDEYTLAKLMQERLARDHAAERGWGLTVVRPGVIFGHGNLWTARLGVRASPTLWIRTGGGAPLPLIYVENAAEAIILALEAPGAAGETLNLVDDEQPTQRRYAALIAARSSPRPRIVPIPWTAMRLVARAAQITNRLVFGDRARVPGLLVPERLHARCKPLRYDNARVKRVLGWRPRYGLAEAIERSCGPREPLDPPSRAAAVPVETPEPVGEPAP